MAETATPAEASTPLLRPRGGPTDSTSRTSALALLLGRASFRRGPSMLVRETTALQLEQRRANWGYSKPVVVLDILWNLALAVVSVVMIACTLKERPNTPIRIWICGYSLQCLVHAILVWLEYRRRNSRRIRSLDHETRASDSEVNDSEDEYMDAGYRSRGGGWPSIAKRWESVNTMTSFLWWIVGFYWIASGGEILFQNAPRLYWLAVVFLAFDVFFAVFCVALACFIGIALCCCLPCIIAFLYAVAGQEGASEADLNILPKYRYEICSKLEITDEGAGSMVPVATSGGYLANKRVLLPEDAECCICLSSYEDGAELHALPCNHHFHATCIVKWLKTNATCPLCKYNILERNIEQV
ncbi:hypothetical protein HHK36_029936 [Tetracentron sinense]|uniref:RING-type E3 ubiquitin transferase n=1 Tax=Tetracentron sinense TaxID=13715 RepID=A0A834YBS1_TETSI|nr:hypothetical protein HHK36_029936 [Tetracentron sinense]